MPMYREREVTGFSEDDAGVDVGLSDGRSLRAEYLVGCDGGRSVVRKAAGIEFPGWDATTSWLIAEAEMDSSRIRPPPRGRDRAGGGGPDTALVLEESVKSAGEPSMEDFRVALIAAEGTDYGLRRVAFVSRFTDMTRQAASYRKGRILLAGDAAHIHAPVGGLGMNVGVQDAVNLGWKLAQVVKGTSPEDLLDSYHAERHPVGAGAARNTMAQMALRRSDERTDALREDMAGLLGMDGPRKRFAGMISGLAVHLRPRRWVTRWSAAACPIWTWLPPTALARVQLAARRTARGVDLREAAGFDVGAVGGSGPAGRGGVRRGMGASRPRRGARSLCRVDPAGRTCRLGRSAHRCGLPDALTAWFGPPTTT